MSTSANDMDLMHQLLSRGFLDMLKEGVEYEAKDGSIKRRKANAAELNTIRQFLKDNNISADAEHNSTLKELSEELPFSNDNVVNFRN